MIGMLMAIIIGVCIAVYLTAAVYIAMRPNLSRKDWREFNRDPKRKGGK